jgi:hypothetical protein
VDALAPLAVIIRTAAAGKKFILTFITLSNALCGRKAVVVARFLWGSGPFD